MPITPSSSATVAAMMMRVIVNAVGAAARPRMSCSGRTSNRARFGSISPMAARTAATRSEGGVQVRTA